MRISDWSSDVCSSDLRARGDELAAAAAAAARKLESGGVPLFYQAGMTATGPALRAKLDEIASAERQNLSDRMAETQMFDEEARSEEHTSELQSLMRISYAVFCLKQKTMTKIYH